MKKILFVANLDKEHILKFHVPTIKKFVDNGWLVDVACAGNETIPYIHKRFFMKWKRNPISLCIFREIRKLRKIIIENNYDIVYCHTPTGGVAGRLASKKMRKKGLKVVYFAHGFHFYKGAPLLNWLIYYPVEKCLSKLTDLIITLNDEDYDLAKKHFSKRSQYYLSKGVGVDLAKYANDNYLFERDYFRQKFNISQNTICLGYVAEIIKNKNQIMLLNCLQILLERKINAKLILVGPDHTNGKFNKIVDNKKLSDNVICLGWRSDANRIISSFDFCTPSSIREGLGLNVVEAMIKGVPVVANDNRGHRTIITNNFNGIIVNANDYVSMADSIIELIQDNNLKKDIIENAFLSAKEYNQSLVVDNLYTVISDIIGKLI